MTYMVFKGIGIATTVVAAAAVLFAIAARAGLIPSD